MVLPLGPVLLFMVTGALLPSLPFRWPATFSSSQGPKEGNARLLILMPLCFCSEARLSTLLPFSAPSNETKMPATWSMYLTTNLHFQESQQAHSSCSVPTLALSSLQSEISSHSVLVNRHLFRHILPGT